MHPGNSTRSRPPGDKLTVGTAVRESRSCQNVMKKGMAYLLSKKRIEIRI